MWNIAKETCGNLKRSGNSLSNFGVVSSVIAVKIFFYMNQNQYTVCAHCIVHIPFQLYAN